MDHFSGSFNFRLNWIHNSIWCPSSAWFLTRRVVDRIECDIWAGLKLNGQCLCKQSINRTRPLCNPIFCCCCSPLKMIYDENSLAPPLKPMIILISYLHGDELSSTIHQPANRLTKHRHRDVLFICNWKFLLLLLCLLLSIPFSGITSTEPQLLLTYSNQPASSWSAHREQSHPPADRQSPSPVNAPPMLQLNPSFSSFVVVTNI